MEKYSESEREFILASDYNTPCQNFSQSNFCATLLDKALENINLGRERWMVISRKTYLSTIILTVKT